MPVVDHPLDDGRHRDTGDRLFTTITDPDRAGAEDLALACAQRWELENVLEEPKTHQRGPTTVLGSKSPLVLHEVWGHLCCHHPIRTPIADTAAQEEHDPDRVSFLAALRVTRRSLADRGEVLPSPP